MSSVSDTISLHDSLQELLNLEHPLINELLEGEKKQLTEVTKVYDMRKVNESFVRGQTVFHDCKDSKSLANFLKGKYQATCVLIEPSEKMTTCFVITFDQMSEIQLLVSFPFDYDEVERQDDVFAEFGSQIVKGTSVARDKYVSVLFDSYTQYQEKADSMFCSNRPSLVRLEQASAISVQFLSTFDKLHFYQDCPQTLRIVHHIDGQREMVFYLECLKCDSVRDIQGKLSFKFHELQCQPDDRKCLWITDASSVLKPSDYIFLQEKPSGRVVHDSLFVHISDYESRPVEFFFGNVPNVVILARNATVRDFRHQSAKILHKTANSLKISCNKEKCEDSKLIVDTGHPQIPLQVELAGEKTLTFTRVEHGENAFGKIEIKVYKMDTIADVKRKLTPLVGFDPFFIKLVQNGSNLDDESTIHSSRIQTSDYLQIVICQNRVKMTLRFKKTKHGLVVDDITQTTISDLKNFCGHVLQCHPFNICIIFKGSALFNNANTLLDEGVVNGSLLFAVVTCQNNSNNKDVITRFIQGGGNGIQKQKAIIHRGRVIPVYDDVQFDDPDPTSCQILQHPRPKGIQISSLTNLSEPMDYVLCRKDEEPVVTMGTLTRKRTLVRPCELKEEICSTLPMTHAEAAMKHLNIGDSKESSVTTSHPQSPNTTSILEMPAALNVSANPPEAIPSPSSLQSCEAFQGGHILSSEVNHVFRSPNGEVLSLERTQAVSFGPPDKLKILFQKGSSLGRIPSKNLQPLQVGSNLSHSISDSALSYKDSSNAVHTPKPIVLGLENAIPERLLNALADKLGNSWVNLAMQLSISFNDIDRIRHNDPRDLKLQALTMLHTWQKANGRNATVNVLCGALRRCELVSIAEEIEHL